MTPAHFDGFYNSRKHLMSAADQIGDLKRLLEKTEGITDVLAGRIAMSLPRPRRGRQSYTRGEFKRIAEAARTQMRTAARRIRENRELLQRFRSGQLEPGEDLALARRLELLEWVDLYADVPRACRTVGLTAGKDFPLPWVQRMGTVVEIVSWLHLTVDEAAAGAVLLGAMTGENPDVIRKVPAAHHRADGYNGPGTAIVDLHKPRLPGMHT